MSDDKYRAKVLAVQTLEIQRELALKKAELSENAVSKMDFEEEEVLSLLKHYPAGFAMSPFVDSQEAFALLEEAKKFSVGAFGVIANQQLKGRLNKRRRLLASFYLEVNRLIGDDFPSFSDNLMLEVTDFLMQEIPLLIALESNTRLAMVAMTAAKVAADIRAQIAWGRVSDWAEFREDILTLGFLVIEMEQLLGNDVSDFSSLEGVTNDPFQGGDAFYAMQAIRAYRESLGI